MTRRASRPVVWTETGKICNSCERDLPLSEYYPQKTPTKTLHRSECKSCWSARIGELHKRTRQQRYATAKAWRDANPERIAAIGRRSKLKREFGLMPGQYESMLAAQGGGCAACGSTDNGDRRFVSFVVDHDHASGAVRGLLCSPCNKALGHVKDDPDRLLALAAYLLQHQNVLGAPLGAST